MVTTSRLIARYLGDNLAAFHVEKEPVWKERIHKYLDNELEAQVATKCSIQCVCFWEVVQMSKQKMVNLVVR